MPLTLAPVRTYKISLMDGTTEKITASAWKDVDGTWIDFFDGGGQVLRLRTQDVERIDVDKG